MSTPSRQRVFLTGASSGIGEALARHYAAQGAVLGLVARGAEKLGALVASLPGEGHMALSADVADLPAMRAAADAFIARHGVPDLVIANAGISVGVLTEHAEDLPVFEAVLRTNVLGLFATFHPFIAAMRARGSGRLVGIASVAGVRGLPGGSAYSASKSAAVKYLEALRVEMRSSGVKVVTIAPGYIRTPLTAVNPYKMPFILEADEAARRFARAIEAGVSYTVIPWQMGLVARLLAMAPNWLFDRVFAKAKHKPRKLPT
ncbi:SDR family oxidoreductase [Niveibacterium sp. 24ML]|uniref:SDR family oxidoreductase n=1 Tax=Niveibacterium sp. 24ML TaxID=2985512 RepID=UPI00226F2DF2|nr:SDR family oxidoreductase [Niveibacterium sp. 24ML]MCX9157381.1 SDR family oxidoreductase [Niveibacterium sp. 24ML]